jgi:hypothetical protein
MHHPRTSGGGEKRKLRNRVYLASSGSLLAPTAAGARIEDLTRDKELSYDVSVMRVGALLPANSTAVQRR